jgi:hypothetical protein
MNDSSPRWCPEVGTRVRLRKSISGTVPIYLSYVVREAPAGALGTVTSTLTVTTDDGITMRCYGNDFEDPDEQFAERFAPIEGGEQ